jgi:hypothetical protein
MGLATPLFGSAQTGIGAGGKVLHLRIGAAAHRLVTIDLALLEEGGDIGIHPVVAAILAAVLHHAAPRLTLLELAPQIGKRGLGHVGVAHHIVVLAHQFGAAVAGHPAEMIVGVGDHTLQIRGGDQLCIGREIDFLINKMGLLFTHVALHSESLLNKVSESGQTL